MEMLPQFRILRPEIGQLLESLGEKRLEEVLGGTEEEKEFLKLIDEEILEKMIERKVRQLLMEMKAKV